MKRTFIAAALAASFGTFSDVAHAAPVSGQIGFFGQANAVDKSSDPASLSSATGISFNNPVTVTAADGDFAAYLNPFTDQATFTSFSFNPLDPSPVNPLWIAGGFSFVLTSITIQTQNASELSLQGNGYVFGNGFANTSGTWSFYGSTSIGASLVGQSFMFESTGVLGSTRGVTVDSVPDEGRTMTLLGLAMAVGLGLRAVTRPSRTAVAQR